MGYEKYVRLYAFVDDMNALYASSDLIISRAGASTVSELCVIARPCILIPSPNVAENHQWHNAMALVRVSAARMEEECENLSSRIMNDIDEILSSDDIRENMSAALKTLARPEATSRIADEVEIILEKTHR
jgi:UDP-N-acetylglucosamine--N-acetylmuramyl-(pentapeptide) pyrophosphoryl-undecaprenol N-acetylglucosamine transferase